MEIPKIMIAKTEGDQLPDPEADNVSFCSVSSSTSASASTKLTSGRRRAGKKLLFKFKKVFTTSVVESPSSRVLTTEEAFACANIAVIPASGPDPTPQTPTLKMKRTKAGTMMEYRETLHKLIVQRLVLANDHQKQNGWDGQFASDSSEKRLLHKLKRQANLSKLESAFIHWEIVLELYRSDRHVRAFQMKPVIICTQFDKMLSLFQNSSSRDEASLHSLNKIFWSQTNALIEFIVEYLIQNSDWILKANPEGEDPFESCARILAHIRRSNQPELLDQMKISLEELVYKYLAKADTLFLKIIWKETPPEQTNDISLSHLVNLGEALVDTIKIRQKYWTCVLYSLDINLFDLIYPVWAEQLGKILETVLPHIASSLKPVNVDIRVLPSSINDADFAVEENAYKLFRILGEFDSYSKCETRLLKSCHKLFVPFVVEWLNITYLKNLVRIQSAVNLDDLSPVTDSSKVSSSLVDVAGLLLKINDFWEELSWPTPEESYSFVVVIIKNLDRCIRHYGDMIWKRVCELEKHDFEKFELSEKLYVALNNIERVQRHAESIIQKLDVPRIVRSMKNFGMQKQHTATMRMLTENMRQTQHRQIVDISSAAWQANMEHMFLMLLSNCAETKSIFEFSEQKLKLTSHAFSVLAAIGQNLSTANGAIVYRTLWTNMICSFETYLESCKRVENPPLIFQHLQIILFDLEKVFEHEALKEDLKFNIQTTDRLLRMKAFMRLHGSSTTDLQIEYLTIRFREQCNADKTLAEGSKIGRLGVIAHYSRTEESLHLEILHAVFQNDVPPTYVKFQILTRNPNPNEDVVYRYTEYKSSKCQLYEKKFTIDIASDHWIQGGMIRFWIKHHGRLHARTHVIAEAFLPLESISIANNNALQKLTLTCPAQTVSKCDILHVLQNRRSEKEAMRFVKRERCRFGLSNNIFIK